MEEEWRSHRLHARLGLFVGVTVPIPASYSESAGEVRIVNCESGREDAFDAFFFQVVMRHRLYSAY